MGACKSAAILVSWIKISNMKITAVGLLMSLALCAGCTTNTTTPVRTNLNAIKEILATERRSHLEKDVSLLLSKATDPVLSVSNGKVSQITPAQSKKSFSEYFNSVEFIRWDDIHDPIFNFSDDSTLAVVTVQKIVVLKEKPTEKVDTSLYAWTAVYRKTGDEWKMIVMTSTDR
jgi:hypothetical protein